jgi:hypothetical protein
MGRELWASRALAAHRPLSIERGGNGGSGADVLLLEKEQGMSSEYGRGASEPAERGKRASFDRQSGAVHGSGSGAGGGGNPGEDYDQDAAAGAGAEPASGPRPIERAVDRPIDRDEGR